MPRLPNSDRVSSVQIAVIVLVVRGKETSIVSQQLSRFSSVPECSCYIVATIGEAGSLAQGIHSCFAEMRGLFF